MIKIGSGLLMYRFHNKNLEVFLVHPGGPFFKNKDSVWSIPKGLHEKRENLLETAKREFCEETSLARRGLARLTFLELGFVEYNGKKVYAWAFEGNLPENFIFKSNTSKFGWPENDKGEFFPIETAKLKILPAQLPFLERLASEVHQTNPRLSI